MQNCEEKLKYKQVDGASFSIPLPFVHMPQYRIIKNYVHSLSIALKT